MGREEKEKKLSTKELDELWKKDQEKEEWVLPEKAHWFLQLPVIRHFRWFDLNLAFLRYSRV
jgi:hypothetical protein